MPIKALVVCKHPENCDESCVCKILKKDGFEFFYSWKNTLCADELKNIDLIISIGGDGTALSASHYIEDKPILAVNSDSEKSVGALTTINLNQLDEKLEQIKNGSNKKELLERIEILINNKKIPSLALNDVFVGNEKSYHISKYKILFKDSEEIQRSSGLIFSTGTGSTAWFKSAGGIPFSPQAKFIKMIVRELYHEKFSSSKIFNLEIRDGEEIKIQILAPSILAIDCIREYPLIVGDIVTLKISKNPLKRIV